MNEAELRLAIVEKMKEIAKKNDCVLFLAITGLGLYSIIWGI